jgi:hypothetical protein
MPDQNNMHRSVIISLLALLGGMGIALAGNLEGNYYADINKDLFITPKSSAMAGSDASLSRSAQPLSNPANLSVDSINRVELAYAGFYRNTFSTSALSDIGSIDRVSSFGVSISYLLVPEIQEYIDSVTPGPISSASELFFRVGYGRALYKIRNAIELSAGGAIDGQRKNLIDKNGYSIGLDAGATVRFTDIGLAASATVENFSTSYTRWNSQYSEFAYPHARLGIGWQHEFEYIYGRLSLSYLTPDLFSNEGLNTFVLDSMEADGESSTEPKTVIVPDRERISKNPVLVVFGKYGAEYVIMNRLAFRAGFNFATLNFTFGAGLGLLDNRAGIDFAYLTHELAPTYKLSVNYKWL